jgi:hypothetical protein
MGDIAGSAAGTAVAGGLVDATSITTALSAAAATAACGATLVAARRQTLTAHRSPPAGRASPQRVP